MLKRITLISAVLVLAACGGNGETPTTSSGQKTAPHVYGEKAHDGTRAEGAEHSHSRAHGGRDLKARAARFKKVAETLGVSEEKLKEVLQSSRDKPRNWDEIGAELGVDGDAVRAAFSRANRSRE